MRDTKEKQQIKIKVFLELLVSIIMNTLILGTIIYYALEFFFKNINISFLSSILFALFLSTLIEWLFTRKNTYEVKLDLEVIDLHNELKYVNINKIIKHFIYHLNLI